MEFLFAIERNRKPLLRIVAMMFGIIGLAEGSTVERLSLPVYRAVLRVLRPAESAVRRLIVVTARGLVVKPLRARAAPEKPIISAQNKGSRHRRFAFQLFDPRQRFNTSYRYRRHPIPAHVQRPVPRIRVIDVGFDPRVPIFRNAASAVPPPPMPVPEVDDTVSAMRLCRRLTAIKSALEDLPRQARRYARWQAKPSEARRPQLASALRPGTPPGHRKNPIHKVDEILTECDWLARRARQSDTS